MQNSYYYLSQQYWAGRPCHVTDSRLHGWHGHLARDFLRFGRRQAADQIMGGTPMPRPCYAHATPMPFFRADDLIPHT